MNQQDDIYDVLELNKPSNLNFQDYANFFTNKNHRWRQNAILRHDYLLWHLKNMGSEFLNDYSFTKIRRSSNRSDKGVAHQYLKRFGLQNDKQMMKKLQKMCKNKYRTFRRYFKDKRHKNCLDFPYLIIKMSKSFICQNSQNQILKNCQELAIAIDKFQKIVTQSKTEKQTNKNSISTSNNIHKKQSKITMHN